jgi:Holliday junction resolvasome RuvABC DNA-binding subunit
MGKTGDAELRAKAYRALTLMGYREFDAKRALAVVPGSSNGSLELLIRRALSELASGSGGSA